MIDVSVRSPTAVSLTPVPSVAENRSMSVLPPAGCFHASHGNAKNAALICGSNFTDKRNARAVLTNNVASGAAVFQARGKVNHNRGFHDVDVGRLHRF